MYNLLNDLGKIKGVAKKIGAVFLASNTAHDK